MGWTVRVLVVLCLAAAALLRPADVRAAKVSNVRQTLHNLSTTSPGSVKTTDSQGTEVCVFCHTPHGAESFPGSPLWNRAVNGATYTLYTSSSLDANSIVGRQLEQPAGSSKLCLSCHDGTLALGTVNVFGGDIVHTFTMAGTNAGKMPIGQGETTGFTRNLGDDLRNDHPIGLIYDATLANRDAELYTPGGTGGTHIGVRGPGVKPTVPLEPTGQASGQPQIQCATCHDPHLYDANATTSIKFLRLNRFQENAPAEGSFSTANDIVCLACHNKKGWSTSAHATPVSANETYTASSAATLREIPAGKPVWQVACLNCHDTHTVHGARRLLREGTDSLSTPKVGGTSAIEETCYQCHTLNPIITNISSEVPNIESDFALPRHMPITHTSPADQLAGTEIHDITDKDFIESTTLLGKNNNLNNRHAECTDCHNPHRVMKNATYDGSGGTAEGTHNHASGHTNVASGVLRGSWGVEPEYGSSAFRALPNSYTVKKGDPGLGGDTGDPKSMTYLSREYQLCLKCHSDYAYDDDGTFTSALASGRPLPGVSGGTTPSGTNNLQEYTNQAMEFQAPIVDRGEPGGNHRSWHPVIGPTERTGTIRGDGTDISNRWNAPWNGAVGTQTMYCTDCHGSRVSATTSVVPDGGANGNPWGPHGSGNNFILKGLWNTSTGTGQQNDGLCFKCHNYSSYATRAENRTGFFNSDRGDLHSFHADKIGRMRCNWCHVAVLHGWKNKAFLVNLNDVGPEAGLAAGTQVRNNTTALYNSGPYYMNAALKIRNFASSGQWQQTDCGSNGAPGNGQSGRDWMRDSSENCDNPP